MVEAWDDDDLGDMAIPSFMFTAAPFITPFHPFSIFVQNVSDPLKAFADMRLDDRRTEDKRLIQGYLGSISDVEATIDDRSTALKGLLEICARGSSQHVIESILEDEDALPTIIEDIQNDEEDETVKFLSTEMLHVVATSNYVDVYQTGGLPAILSVLKTENTKVLHSALLSLQHITQLGSACAECFKCNVVQYCVHLMHKRTVDVLLTASHILHNLVVDHADPHIALSDCRRLTSERYFSEIVKVVADLHAKLEPSSRIGKTRKREVRASNSLSLQSQKVLSTVLAILAGSDEATHIVLTEDDVRRLVAMLSYKHVREVVINACTILQALLHVKLISFDRASRLTDSLVETTLSLARQEEAPTAAVILLIQLIHQRTLSGDDILKKDIGRLLVTHLKSKNEDASVAAARGITYLCSPYIVDGPEVKEGTKLHRSVAPHLGVIVKHLLSVVRGTLEGTELRPASVMCAGLAAIAQHESGRKAMLKQPVFESLCALIAKTGADQVEKEAAALAVLHISKLGRLIDPAANAGHREALKLLSTQLHSKNPHVQACTLTAFLTLCKDGVRPDCIYGKALEQLKSVRVNAKVAKDLYHALTEAKLEELENEEEGLNPSAAKRNPAVAAPTGKKNKKGVKVQAALPNGGTVKFADAKCDEKSLVEEAELESSTKRRDRGKASGQQQQQVQAGGVQGDIVLSGGGSSSDENDAGPNNNMFSALLSTGKKKKKRDDHPSAGAAGAQLTSSQSNNNGQPASQAGNPASSGGTKPPTKLPVNGGAPTDNGSSIQASAVDTGHTPSVKTQGSGSKKSKAQQQQPQAGDSPSSAASSSKQHHNEASADKLSNSHNNSSNSISTKQSPPAAPPPDLCASPATVPTTKRGKKASTSDPSTQQKHDRSAAKTATPAAVANQTKKDARPPADKKPLSQPQQATNGGRAKPNDEKQPPKTKKQGTGGTATPQQPKELQTRASDDTTGSAKNQTRSGERKRDKRGDKDAKGSSAKAPSSSGRPQEQPQRQTQAASDKREGKGQPPTASGRAATHTSEQGAAKGTPASQPNGGATGAGAGGGGPKTWAQRVSGDKGSTLLRRQISAELSSPAAFPTPATATKQQQAPLDPKQPANESPTFPQSQKPAQKVRVGPPQASEAPEGPVGTMQALPATGMPATATTPAATTATPPTTTTRKIRRSTDPVGSPCVPSNSNTREPAGVSGEPSDRKSPVEPKQYTRILSSSAAHSAGRQTAAAPVATVHSGGSEIGKVKPRPQSTTDYASPSSSTAPVVLSREVPAQDAAVSDPAMPPPPPAPRQQQDLQQPQPQHQLQHQQPQKPQQQQQPSQHQPQHHLQRSQPQLQPQLHPRQQQSLPQPPQPQPQPQPPHQQQEDQQSNTDNPKQSPIALVTRPPPPLRRVELSTLSPSTEAEAAPFANDCQTLHLLADHNDSRPSVPDASSGGDTTVTISEGQQGTGIRVQALVETLERIVPDKREEPPVPPPGLIALGEGDVHGFSSQFASDANDTQPDFAPPRADAGMKPVGNQATGTESKGAESAGVESRGAASLLTEWATRMEQRSITSTVEGFNQPFQVSGRPFDHGSLALDAHEAFFSHHHAHPHNHGPSSTVNNQRRAPAASLQHPPDLVSLEEAAYSDANGSFGSFPSQQKYVRSPVGNGQHSQPVNSVVGAHLRNSSEAGGSSPHSWAQPGAPSQSQPFVSSNFFQELMPPSADRPSPLDTQQENRQQPLLMHKAKPPPKKQDPQAFYASSLLDFSSLSDYRADRSKSEDVDKPFGTIGSGGQRGGQSFGEYCSWQSNAGGFLGLGSAADQVWLRKDAAASSLRDAKQQSSQPSTTRQLLSMQGVLHPQQPPQHQPSHPQQQHRQQQEHVPLAYQQPQHQHPQNARFYPGAGPDGYMMGQAPLPQQQQHHRHDQTSGDTSSSRLPFLQSPGSLGSIGPPSSNHSNASTAVGSGPGIIGSFAGLAQMHARQQQQ
ncbi:hypothetical protein DIPPA_13813 [Diplonema papillatum]|nr:hypothetical protein DIPPA_13813 [Diplonema papillatum]